LIFTFPEDPSHLYFVVAGSILRVKTFEISVPEWVKRPKALTEVVKKVIVLEFKPREDVKIETEESTTSANARATLEARK
jgi:ubiquitin-activating enzyme E1